MKEIVQESCPSHMSNRFRIDCSTVAKLVLLGLTCNTSIQIDPVMSTRSFKLGIGILPSIRGPGLELQRTAGMQLGDEGERGMNLLCI
jgi:hypothetical protein